MPSTLVGLLVALVALLPGGVHTWSFERETGKAEHQASDRLPRLLAASALYLVLSAPALPTFRAVATSAATGATTVAWRYALTVVLLIVLPYAIGTVAGKLVNRRHEKGVRAWLGRRVAGPGHAAAPGTICSPSRDSLARSALCSTTTPTSLAPGPNGRAKSRRGSAQHQLCLGLPKPAKPTSTSASSFALTSRASPSRRPTRPPGSRGASIRYLEFYPQDRAGEGEQ